MDFNVNGVSLRQLGAIEGTHIPILRPQESVSDDYYNQKGYHSLLMEAVVEHRSLFLDVNIGWPGKVHHARVFVNFSFYLKVNAGTFFPVWSVGTISPAEVPRAMRKRKLAH